MDFLVGVLSGLLIGATVQDWIIETDDLYRSLTEKKIIKQCESNPPREQHCKIIAVKETE